MDKKIRKRDLIYIFIIIILFFVAVTIATLYLRRYVTDYSLFTDFISLASGICSIILAIVAIIYAFYQSYESAKQSNTVEGLLSQVRKKVDEIGPLKQEVLDSRNEITKVLSEMSNSLVSSFHQFNSELKDSGKDLEETGELYESFLTNYIKTFYKVLNEKDIYKQKGISKKESQDFHVVLTTFELEYRELDDNIALDYISYFRKETSISAIASNITVFSDITGLSFTLSIFRENHWDAKEVKRVLEKYHKDGLSVFTVAELIY